MEDLGKTTGSDLLEIGIQLLADFCVSFVDVYHDEADSLGHSLNPFASFLVRKVWHQD